MGEHECFLVTLLQEYKSDKILMKCALKIKRREIPQEFENEKFWDEKNNHPNKYFYMEEGFRKFLHSKLPLHVQNCGPIVQVDEIFEIHEVK